MNNLKNKFQIKYFPIIICLRCKEAVELPYFMGSMLHGIMGWALTAYPKVYQYLFENKRIDGSGKDTGNPYLIDPPEYKTNYQIGDDMRFQFVLIGDSVRYRKEVIEAIVKKQEFQLGAGRKRFSVEQMIHGSRLQTIWTKKNPMLIDNSSLQVELVNDWFQKKCEHCSVQLLTPLRIRRNGELLTELDFPTIIRNIGRRLSDIVTRYGGQMDEQEAERILSLAQEINITSKGLHICNIERYSTRRSKKMDFSGLMGAMTFEGDLTVFVPWLNAAEILHIGRNVTFGCGKVRIIFS